VAEGGSRRRRALALLALAALAAGCSGVRRPRLLTEIRAVDADVAYAMLRDAPDLVVVDVREVAEFEAPAGHLRFARNLPLSRLDRFYGMLAPLRETSFLVYCRGDDGCGEEAVARLVAAGFRNAVVLEGGFAAWVAHGYPVLSAEPPAGGDPTREALRATHRWDFEAGRLLDGGRDGASGLYVAGRMVRGRFRPVGSVEGSGEFCRGWEIATGERGRRGWLELARGEFLGEEGGRLPGRPFVRGCLGADGKFRPEARDVTP
jgi:rhodanese-related sulfurtransferase